MNFIPHGLNSIKSTGKLAPYGPIIGLKNSALLLPIPIRT